MRIRIIGDHSNVHAGSVAVIEVLRNEVKRHGKIVDDDSYDLLVVNGEGSMHHGSRTCQEKIRAISEALQNGRKAVLANSLWQDNPSELSTVLRGCQQVTVREVLSQRELAKDGISAEVSIDLSYFRAIDESEEIAVTDDRPATTDFYAPDLKRFVRITGSFDDAHEFIDMRRMSWSELVSRLRRKPLLLTGRHHAVYAACKARTPFIVMQGNSHKIEGLFATAGVEIPVLKTLGQVLNHLDWPARHRDRYEQLFDWMESQPPWRLRVS